MLPQRAVALMLLFPLQRYTNLLFFVLLLLAGFSQTVQAQIRYVRIGGNGDGSSWSNASGNVQAMIDAGAGQVWVATGTYYPLRDANGGSTTDRTATFRLRDGAEVYGGFPASGDPQLTDRNTGTYPTILSGNLGNANVNTDNAYHVVSVYLSSGAAAKLDGVTVRDGNTGPDAPLSYLGGGSVDGAFGGGIYVVGSDGLVVSNCIIENNTGNRDGLATVNTGAGTASLSFDPGGTNKRTASAVNDLLLPYGTGAQSGSGGGIFLANGSPQFLNCIIRNNLSGYLGGGGALLHNNANATFTNCTFDANSSGANGIGGDALRAWQSKPTFVNCRFANHRRAGGPLVAGPLHFYQSAATLRACVFENNGIGTTNGSGSFRTLTAGVMSVGTAISLEYAYNDDQSQLTTIDRCVFANNTVTVSGVSSPGPISAYYGPAQITNSLFTNNTAVSYPLISNNLTGGTFAQSGLELVNCTFGRNTATNAALFGGITMQNAVVWDNVSETLAIASSFSYSDMQGLAVDNPNTDPKFADPANPKGADGNWATTDDGYNIKPISYLINAGASTSLITQDITGVSRTGNPDLGAYEAASGPCTLSIAIASNPAGTPTTLTITQGNRATLTVGGTNGSPTADSYAWSANAGNAQTVSITLSAAGTYSVTGISGVCSATASLVVSVTVPPALTLVTTANQTTLCAGSSTNLSVTATGGIKPYTYAWIAPSGAGISGAGNTSTVSAFATTSGTKVFSVIVTSAGGTPVKTGTVSVTANAIPTMVVTPNPGFTITTGSTGTLTVSGADNFVWSANTGNANTVSVTTTTAGVYSVTGTTKGCSSVTTVSVTVKQICFPFTTLLVGSGNLSCLTPTLSITAVGGSYYVFEGPGVVSQTDGRKRIIVGDYLLLQTPLPTVGVAIVNKPGLYRVTVTDEKGCPQIAQLIVTGQECR
jgi:hypothetical protein